MFQALNRQSNGRTAWKKDRIEKYLGVRNNEMILTIEVTPEQFVAEKDEIQQKVDRLIVLNFDTGQESMICMSTCFYET